MWSHDFKHPNPPVNDETRMQVEQLLGVDLPDAYVGLMRERNGGYLEEQLIHYQGDIPPDMDYYVGERYIPIGMIAGINPKPEASGSVTQTPLMIREWRLPEGLVLLDGDGHTWIALDYRQAKTNPPVVFLVSEIGQHITIAGNFADLLDKMVPYDRVYDENGELRIPI